MRIKSMISRHLLIMAIYISVGLICCSYAAKNTDSKKPNFIFFIADDVSQVDLGCYGHPSIKRLI